MYTPKKLSLNEEARQGLINGIEKIHEAVSSTLGPRGNTVLLEDLAQLGGMTVTKDGVTVAKAIDLQDPIENLAVRIMKQAADKTATEAGDGTTTSIVLAYAILMSAYREKVAFDNGKEMGIDNLNKTMVIRHMTEVKDEVVAYLSSQSLPVDDSKLHDVATISCNNDPVLGKIISDVYRMVGADGLVTIERSNDSSTYFSSTDGMRIERGYKHPQFINNQERDECILEDVRVLVSDAEIHNILQLENILEPIVKNHEKLLIIAPCSDHVLNTFAANVAKGKIQMCVIQPPQFGYKQHELMSDIAVSVGANYFSEKTGDDLSLITYDDLGHVDKMVVGREETIVINSEEKTDVELVDERVAQLRAAEANAKTQEDKNFILSRIASLTGGVGVIYVGGQTDIEHKELYDRVDDAVRAVRSALLEGVLPGAGTALAKAAMALEGRECESVEQAFAFMIMQIAMLSPCEKILSNGGWSIEKAYPDGFDEGFNLKTEQWGDLIQMGVIDPLKVTRCALENATSVATTILSTSAVVTMARDVE